jgi:hypothetical protein
LPVTSNLGTCFQPVFLSISYTVTGLIFMWSNSQIWSDFLQNGGEFCFERNFSCLTISREIAPPRDKIVKYPHVFPQSRNITLPSSQNSVVGIARILKGGRFIKIPRFSSSISKIFFCVADFHGQFQSFSQNRTPTPGHTQVVRHENKSIYGYDS